MTHARLLGHVELHRVHLAVVTPPLADSLFYVSTYKAEDPHSNAPDKHGYQRPPIEDRFPKIAGYFTIGDNQFLITPIIVSVRLTEPKDIEKFLNLLGSGDGAAIKKAFNPQVASVVDGQHRYLGLVHAWKKNPEFLPQIPIMLCFKLTYVQEAMLFNTINVNQQKLPKALIETTKGDIVETGAVDYQQKIRRITFGLCRDGDSVWGPVDGKMQINMTGMRDPEKAVTYEGLRRSMSNMFSEDLLDRLEAMDADLPTKLAKRYWAAVAKACATAWNAENAETTVEDPATGDIRTIKIKYRIKDLVGVASLARLGKTVITTQLDSHDATKIDRLTEKLNEVNWSKDPENVWMRSQAGFAGQKELYQVLHNLVYLDRRPE